MSVAYLTGVLDDGTDYLDPAVPLNPRTTLELTQGVSTTVRMTIINPGGVPVAANGTLRLTIKKRPQDVPAIASIIGAWAPQNGPGACEFAIGPTTLAGQDWGLYCYDVRLTQAGVQNLVMPTSPCRLAPAVSEIV
jgi:hypothetical protein